MNLTALKTQLAGRQTSWLAIDKHGRGVELGAVENNSSWCLERDLRFQIRRPNNLAMLPLSRDIKCERKLFV